jgi:Na+/H+-dicarboxylate symporter
VLPYIVLSIVYGLGRIQPTSARKLAGVGAVTVLVLWTMGIVASLLMPLSYPDWQSARFFSHAMVERPPELDLFRLYIPRNIFASLNETAVPAVVVFCILLGVALMGVERKDTLVEALGSLADAVMRLVGLVVKTAPIGIFALAAAASGTIRLEEMGTIQVYVWGYLAMAGVLVFWALPMLISTVTGIGFRRVFAASRDALVTGFATGSLLVVLPLLSTAIKDLLAERGVHSEDEMAMVDLVVPTAFNLPSVGMLLTMSFVHFGAWLFDSPLALGQYAAFAALSVVTAFGGWTIGLPALLDAFRTLSTGGCDHRQILRRCSGRAARRPHVDRRGRSRRYLEAQVGFAPALRREHGGPDAGDGDCARGRHESRDQPGLRRLPGARGADVPAGRRGSAPCRISSTGANPRAAGLRQDPTDSGPRLAACRLCPGPLALHLP